MHGALNRITIVFRHRRRHASARAAVTCEPLEERAPPEWFWRRSGQVRGIPITGGGNELVRERQKGGNVWGGNVRFGWGDDQPAAAHDRANALQRSQRHGAAVAERDVVISGPNGSPNPPERPRQRYHRRRSTHARVGRCARRHARSDPQGDVDRHRRPRRRFNLTRRRSCRAWG